MSFLGNLFSFDFNPEKAYAKELALINSLVPEIEKMSGEQMKAEMQGYRDELRGLDNEKQFKKLEQLRPRVFALTREAMRRSVGKFHYDVQILGGIALSEGKIAELKTGEGKTYVAVLALSLFALAGKGAHLVTVNDYLSRWHASLVGPIFHYLGFSVGSIQHEASFVYDPSYQPEEGDVEKMESEVEGLVLDVKHMRPVGRKDAYAADITYGTNNEFGFDYLRDNMVQSWAQMVQRDLFYVIVDEVDSILIDEARTPLIISAPDTDPTDKYYQFAKIVNNLSQDTHYAVDEKRKVSTLTDEGINEIEKILSVKNLYETAEGVSTLHHIEQALRAKANYLKDRDYVVRNGEVVIVDEFTGRLMFGRRYSQGLHQAIEAKENVQIQQESKTLATITFQNLFRLYARLSGMTGTAKTEEEEFFKIYSLPIVQVPTNKPLIRNDRSDMIYKTEEAKFRAIAKDVKARHQKGQPVLIGTVSIAKNEALAQHLKKEGVPFELLNAKNHEREASIIAQAGRPGAVTLATNIAGRGVDILLGGNPVDPEEAERVRDAGGLLVLGTERHESRRIDNQLRGRSGRQGDPGESVFYVSMEDDLMRLFGGEKMKNIMQRLGVADDQPLEVGVVSRSIEQAQKKIEGLNFDTRKHVLEFDDVLNHQRSTIYKRRRKYLEGLPTNSSQPASSADGKTENSGEVAGESDESEKLKVESEVKQKMGDRQISDEILEILEQEIADVVTSTFSVQEDREEALKQVLENVSSMFPVSENLKANVKQASEDAANAEFAVIDTLVGAAKELHKKKEEEFGKPVYEQMQRFVALRAVDQLWMEHLDTMDHLRDSVRLRGYGQRDPLVEYKREGHQMFKRLQKEMDRQIAQTALRVVLRPEQREALRQEQAAGAQASNWVTNRTDAPGQGGAVSSSSVPRGDDGEKVGRNDPCPCGSGKKYKKCGMINAPEHKR